MISPTAKYISILPKINANQIILHGGMLASSIEVYSAKITITGNLNAQIPGSTCVLTVMVATAVAQHAVPLPRSRAAAAAVMGGSGEDAATAAKAAGRILTTRRRRGATVGAATWPTWASCGRGRAKAWPDPGRGPVPRGGE